jgi:hypothetical protein
VFTARTLLDGVRSGIGRQANETADTIVQQVAKLRIEHESGSVFHATLERPPTVQKIQRGTRLVLKELLRGLVLDRSTSLSRNHAVDFLHRYQSAGGRATAPKESVGMRREVAIDRSGCWAPTCAPAIRGESADLSLT